MVPLPMVVRHELVEGPEQATYPEKDQAIETLPADRAHKALRVRGGIRRLDGRQHDPHARALDDAVVAVRPLGVPVADEEPMACQKSIDRIGQASRGRRHKPGIRGGRRARHANSSLRRSITKSV
jgi:hypothetical protein